MLVDRYTGKPIAPIIVQSADGRPLSRRDLDWVDRAELDRETYAA